MERVLAVNGGEAGLLLNGLAFLRAHKKENSNEQLDVDLLMFRLRRVYSECKSEDEKGDGK